MYSEKCERLYKAWNVGVRIAFNVSRYTHKYLIESISNVLHPKVMLSSRYIGFHKTLSEKCTKPVVKILSKLNTYDLRTVYGSNLKKISISCNTEIGELTPCIVKEKMRYRQISNEDIWSLDVINDLLLAREEKILIPNFDKKEIEDMLNFVCSI